MKLSKIILLVWVLLFIGQAFYYFPKLPEIMASHFNAGGQANGFMSKASFFALEGVIGAFLVCISLAMEKTLPLLPNSMINLPNKDYWLAPERRVDTFAAMGDSFKWMSIAVVALFVAINQIVFDANIAKTDPDPSRFWILLAIFVSFTLVMLLTTFKRFFSIPPE